METKEWIYRNRENWGKGEWDDEPDKKQWKDSLTGLPCLAVRGPGGNWCGYVGVDKNHSLYKKGYDEVGVSVHGGLTFSSFCAEEDKEHGICHIPDRGEPDNVWWFGFDCAHLGDLCPAWKHISWPTDVYKTLEYVESECSGLAQQLCEY